jgi:hypothetical protein
MTLPLGRPLKYAAHGFVQPVRATREAIPRFAAARYGGPAPLIDAIGSLASTTFDPDRLHPNVRAFWEGMHPSMWVESLRWERWALALAAPYVPLAAAAGNLRVRDRIDVPTPMSSSVRRVEWPDGSRSREWIRTFTGTSELFYAAAMRPWTDGDRSYLSMAFPFGRAHLMVLLRLHNHGGGMQLSTRDDDLAGTYMVIPLARHFVALPGPPTQETLSNGPSHDGVVVQHEGFAAGRRTFAMRYRIVMGAPVGERAQPYLPSM